MSKKSKEDVVLTNDDFKEIIGDIVDEIEYLAEEISGHDDLVELFGDRAEKIFEYLELIESQLDVACKVTKIGLTKTIIKKIRDFVKKG